MPDLDVGRAVEPVGLALEGTPGIGKTTLWRAALESARGRGYRVLTTAPGEPDAVLAFLTKEAEDTTTYSTNPLWKVIDGPWELQSFGGDSSPARMSATALAKGGLSSAG